MQHKNILFGVTIPLEDLPIPKGLFGSLYPPERTAVLAALSTTIGQYCFHRRQTNFQGPAPEQDGSADFRNLLSILVPKRDLRMLEPLTLLPPLVFSHLESLLGNKDSVIVQLIGNSIPSIKYDQEQLLEVMWFNTDENISH